MWKANSADTKLRRKVLTLVVLHPTGEKTSFHQEWCHQGPDGTGVWGGQYTFFCEGWGWDSETPGSLECASAIGWLWLSTIMFQTQIQLLGSYLQPTMVPSSSLPSRSGKWVGYGKVHHISLHPKQALLIYRAVTRERASLQPGYWSSAFTMPLAKASTLFKMNAFTL